MMKEQMSAALEFVTKGRFRKSVVPLLRSVDGGPLVPTGTGTLFQIADEHFLITAAHVTDDLKDGDNMAALVTCDVEGSEAVQLTGFALPDSRTEVDVCVFRLDPIVKVRLPSRVPLRLFDVCLDDPEPNAPIFLHGYPQDLQKRLNAQHELTSLTFSTKLFLGPSPDSFDPDLHVLVGDPAAELTSNVEDHASFPELGGISGSSIWCGFTPAAGIQQTLQDIKVIAVQTGVYRKSKLIKGTRWEVVLKLIYDNCPELRGAISVNSEALRIQNP